jgi:sialic acid synthase SpsE
MIVLDFGSGNTCRNDIGTIKQMLDELKKVDTGKHEIVIKFQLFKEAGENIPLDRKIFEQAFKYASKLGYRTTSSVFDLDTLKFLLQFDVPFIKIANRRELDTLIGEIPRKMLVMVSYGSTDELKVAPLGNMQRLLCVSEYPAGIEDYEKAFDISYYVSCGYGISDHTVDFELWHKYQPQIVEWHYKIEDSDGLDAGPFARTPAQLRKIL